MCGHPTKKLSLSIYQPTMDSLHTLRERRGLLSPSPLHDRQLMGPIPCRCLTGNHRCHVTPGRQRSTTPVLFSLHTISFQKRKQRYLDTINDAVNLVRLKPLLISTFSKPVSSLVALPISDHKNRLLKSAQKMGGYQAWYTPLYC